MRKNIPHVALIVETSLAHGRGILSGIAQYLTSNEPWSMYVDQRKLNNVFIKRLWRSVKYEEVYLRDYADGWEAEEQLRAYFRFYSHERIHQALGYRTPADVYRGRR